ncbi:hypothetical protein K438DRAFT_1764467 [Mycena galopus ATCC 62051]|nr:hypothetical protein K438DRAFT_1764467 [Mycena galopus ATCC 62051]
MSAVIYRFMALSAAVCGGLAQALHWGEVLFRVTGGVPLEIEQARHGKCLTIKKPGVRSTTDFQLPTPEKRAPSKSVLVLGQTTGIQESGHHPPGSALELNSWADVKNPRCGPKDSKATPGITKRNNEVERYH